ncbi:MAG: DUF429 domain-containing protein [Gammaproteobacteria bacterium]|nr:DUF429 domain-containing protein [Gammaproteobacteria bacterium]
MEMLIFGIDFTSRPSRRKSLTCLECSLSGKHLRAGKLNEWRSYEDFEAALNRSGPWVAGIDFPFGQSRFFIETIGWPQNWAKYVSHVGSLTRKEFRQELDDYRKQRPYGDKEHRRKTDVVTSSISPQKLYGTPVGLMFYEGAPRILKSGTTIPLLHQGDPDRIIVEAYPAVLVRQLIGRCSYKNDTKAKQTRQQYQARADLLKLIKDKEFKKTYGITVEASETLIEDPGADTLDALICAIQAAWAYTQNGNNFGIPKSADPIEGWISHPTPATA